MSKRILTILLTVCLVISLMPVTVQAAGYTGTPDATGITGSGVTTNPFIITNADQLAYVAQQVNASGTIETVAANTACYKLGGDINLSCYTNWTPIGLGAVDFGGIFDGDGKCITNLTINTNSLNWVGLFGASSGTIQNISVTNVNITSTYGSRGIGGLVGINDISGIVQNCYTTGTVSSNSTTADIGGLVGNNNGATVQNCYSMCNVVGGNATGGLLGMSAGTYAVVQNCYATGNVESDGAVGGLVGYTSWGMVLNGYWLSTSVQKVNGSTQTNKGIGGTWGTVNHTNVISFTGETLVSEVYGTTILPSALNAWVLSQGSNATPSHLYCWTTGTLYPQFGPQIVTYALTNLSATIKPDAVNNGNQLSATLTADSGYTLPVSIIVKMGGKTLEVTTDYSYNSATGIVMIPSVTGNVMITAVAEVSPTYTITVDSTSKDFGSQEVGTTVPAAQTVTVTNTGNTSLTLTQPTSTDYTIGMLSATTLAAGGTATFTIQPKAGLIVGSYHETITVNSNHSTSATVNVTYAVNVALDPDIATVDDAKSAAQNANYSDMTQATATGEAAIVNVLKAAAETAVNNSSVTTTINKDSYIAPIAGTSANPSGTAGSYVFTIIVSKGSQSQTTIQKTITITATAYTGITDVQAVAAAKAALVNGSANAAFGADQAAKTAAVQSYVNGILSETENATGVSATVTYNSSTEKYDVVLNKGNTSNSKSLTMIVIVAPSPATSAPAGSAPTTETNTETKTITVVEVPQSIPNEELLTVEPVGEAFDNSVEVRLKEDTITEGMVRTAIETVSSSLNIENAQIFPLDISIYLKGTDTKVQPKEGTAVMITCPIPTEMLTNMDKLVVVCVIDGRLQVLPATLVTKDGVPCVQFTATHFSPYAIVIDKDNNLADYAAGTLSDDITYISTKLTATAGTVTKVELEGIRAGATITYHVCTPTLISIDSNGNLFTKKVGNAILMARVTYDGATTVYTIRVTVKNTKGGTKVGFIQYYDDIVTYNKINYRITAEAMDTEEGTVAVANNQINKNLPKKVVIPATITCKGKTYRVTSIDESAFYNLNNITSVTIPAGVEEISETAFVSCDSLKTFTVSSDNKYYSAKKGMLLNKEGTTLIAYPSAKGTIVIDKKVAVIGAYAFSACKYLIRVVIPTTITRIEGDAFAHSKSLVKVTFQSATVPEIPFLCIFEKVNEACSILVPETSLIKYRAAFKNAKMPKGASVK